MSGVQTFLDGEDPLTRESAVFLVGYDEEDDRVDYKQDFDIDSGSEKAWLELAKDVSAFANTYGGFLVFGVSDEPKEVVGLARDRVKVLKDTNNLLQKINRFLEPDIVGLRSKEFRFGGSPVVVLYVPRSVGVTHLISRDGVFKHPSGKEKTLLRKGTFYVRRSAANHLGDSRDLTDVIERRVEQFRDTLIDKVARVVRAPSDSDLFILTKDPESKEAERFIIEDSPDSIPIKGMSFTVAPEGPEEEIAAWSVLARGSSVSRPRAIVVWNWYRNREALEISDTHRLTLMQFSLWEGAPAFYWIRGHRAQKIREYLLSTIRNRPNSAPTETSLAIAAFLGKRTYAAALVAFGPYKGRLNPRLRSFPEGGARSVLGSFTRMHRQTEGQLRKEKLGELNSIAADAVESGRIPSVQKRWDAAKIDCFLYAQDEGYK